MVGVDAKTRIAEFLLHDAEESGILRGDGDGRRISASDFLREGWTTERAHGRCVVTLKHLSNHFGHALQRTFFQTFGCADN